jgi:hypothetical protein
MVATGANALGDYLRARREQLRRNDVGLVPGPTSPTKNMCDVG